MVQGLNQIVGNKLNDRLKNRCGNKNRNRIKSYVILCTRDRMIVPIKADRNPYTDLPWFAGGTPQFFGGSPQGNPLQTLQREVGEESRGTLRLNASISPVYTAPPSDADRNTYQFFYSVDWDYTGTHWNENDLPRNQREMQRLVEVQRDIFAGASDPNVIIGILVNATNTVVAPGSNDFNTSHTATAFVEFIKNIWFTL